MIVGSQSTPLDQWRQHLGGRHRRVQPRPLAAMGYRVNGPAIDGLVAIENLILVLLYDDLIRPGHCALRLVGYSGIRWHGSAIIGNWQQAVAVFADLGHFPKRQVFPLRPDDLIGYHDAAEFNFRSGFQRSFRQWQSPRAIVSLAG